MRCSVESRLYEVKVDYQSGHAKHYFGTSREQQLAGAAAGADMDAQLFGNPPGINEMDPCAVQTVPWNE